MKRIILLAATLAATLLFVGKAHATRFKGLQAIDKETLVVQFQDGDVRYRDNGTGPSAFLGTRSWTGTTPSWCSTRGWTRP